MDDNAAVRRATQDLQAAGVAVPIIYCTAESDTDERLRRRLLQAGALAVLYEPFDPSDSCGWWRMLCRG